MGDIGEGWAIPAGNSIELKTILLRLLNKILQKLTSNRIYDLVDAFIFALDDLMKRDDQYIVKDSDLNTAYIEVQLTDSYEKL